jgi:hypothetical protein
MAAPGIANRSLRRFGAMIRFVRRIGDAPVLDLVFLTLGLAMVAALGVYAIVLDHA